MSGTRTRSCATLVVVMIGVVTPGAAQTPGARSYGRVSFYVTSADRTGEGAGRRHDTEMWTGVTFQTPDAGEAGPEVGLDLRYSRYVEGGRPPRTSVYEGFAGVRLGDEGGVRLRAGHMYLPELGSVGAIAGGLGEVRIGSGGEESRLRLGAFTGLEPALYGTGYATGVRKHGGYLSIERGFLRRHQVGYTLVRQGSATERSVVTLTNFVPAGSAFFLYQAAELDVQGPADGTAARGLSYLLTNARASMGRVELLGTYNRGRSIDARTLTEDLRSGRPLTPQAIDGLRYESAGGRVTVEVMPQVRVYGGYSRDRNNREDAPSDRLTIGGHAGNVMSSGFDVSGSDSRMERSSGAYHSMYFSVGRSLGRALYVSVDYSTSLSVVRFLRSDGLIIETRPSTRRVSGTASANVARNWSLQFTLDHSRDDVSREIRVLSGLSYRLR